MSNRRLEQKTVLVTGAASGIGRAIALALCAAGAHVLINYRTRAAEAETLQQDIIASGGSATLLPADLENPFEVGTMLESIHSIGGVHGLVHAASAPLVEEKFRKASWETFEQHWNVAVRSAFLIVQGLINMKGSPQLESVVFLLSSVTIGVPPIEKASYITAKYALLGLARSLAVECAGRKMRINCISPGFTETPLTAHVDHRIKDMIARAIPMKRLAESKDIAACAVFLMSGDSEYITGVNLPVCGGGAM